MGTEEWGQRNGDRGMGTEEWGKGNGFTKAGAFYSSASIPLSFSLFKHFVTLVPAGENVGDEVGVADFGDLVGGDLKDAAFFTDDAAFILFGGDLAGIDNVLQKITQRVAVVRTCEVLAIEERFEAVLRDGACGNEEGEQNEAGHKVTPETDGGRRTSQQILWRIQQGFTFSS